MPKMFQISADDLRVLEDVIPKLCDTVGSRPEATNKDRTRIRVVKRILSDIRFDYGPPTDVENVPAGE